MSPIVWLVAVDLLIVAPIAAWLATQKGRSPSLWFIVAAIAGPVALFALGLAPARWDIEEAGRPTRRCPECDTRVSAVAVRCPACRTKLPPVPEPEPEPEPEAAPIAVPESVAMPEPQQPLEALPGRGLEPEVPEAAIVTTVVRRGARNASASTAMQESEQVEPEPGGRGAQNLASGVFAGGATELVVGYRYLIGVTARQLRISGPVDVAPDRIVLRAPRNSVEAAALGSDIVIGAEPSPGRRVQLVFRGVAGGQGNHLVTVLDRGPEPPPKRPGRSPRTPAD